MTRYRKLWPGGEDATRPRIRDGRAEVIESDEYGRTVRARDGGVINVLDAIDITGDPDAAPTDAEMAAVGIDVDAIDTGAEPETAMQRARRVVVGDLVENPRTGETEYEMPPWAGRVAEEVRDIVPDTVGEAVDRALEYTPGGDVARAAVEVGADAIGRLRDPRGDHPSLGDVATRAVERVTPRAARSVLDLVGDAVRPESAEETQATREGRTVSPSAVGVGVADGLSPFRQVMTEGLDALTEAYTGAESDQGARFRRARRGARELDPNAYEMGRGIGEAASVAVPGMSSASHGVSSATGQRALLGGVPRVALGAAEGAAMGGAAGYGASDAESLDERLGDARTGAALGGVLGGGLAAASARSEGRRAQIAGETDVDRAMRDAEIEALRTQRARHMAARAGISRLSDQDRIATGTDRMSQDASLRRIMETLEQAGAFDGDRLLRPTTRDEVQRRIRRLAIEAGMDLDAARSQLEGRDVDVSKIIQHLRQRIDHYDAQGSVQARQLAQRLRSELAEIERVLQHRPGVGTDAIDWSALQGRRTTHRRATNPNSDNLGQTERGALYRAETEAAQGAADAAGIGPEYQSARERFRAGRLLDEQARRGEARDATNRQLSLTDSVGMHAGAAGAGPVGGVVGALANRFIRGREHGIAQRFTERAIERLRTQPERFGRWAAPLQAAASRSPRAFAAALYTAQQRDPAVRQALRDDEEQQRDTSADGPTMQGDAMADDPWSQYEMALEDDPWAEYEVIE